MYKVTTEEVVKRCVYIIVDELNSNPVVNLYTRHELKGQWERNHKFYITDLVMYKFAPSDAVVFYRELIKTFGTPIIQRAFLKVFGF